MKKVRIDCRPYTRWRVQHGCKDSTCMA